MEADVILGRLSEYVGLAFDHLRTHYGEPQRVDYREIERRIRQAIPACPHCETVGSLSTEDDALVCTSCDLRFAPKEA